MVPIFLWRGLLILAGIAMAGIACAAFIVSASLLATTPDAITGDFRETWSYGLSLGLGLFVAGSVLAYAAGPALIAAILTEFFRVRSVLVHIALGGGAAMLGYGLLTLRLFDDSAFDGSERSGLLILLAAGFVGGLVYWLVTGRTAGGSPEAEDDPAIRRAVDKALDKTRQG